MSSKYSRRNRNRIATQFVAMRVEMLESPAWRALSLSGHRVVARVCVEHAHHGGRDNGKLPVSYDDFEHYGIHRHSIAAAIREAVALGFLRITREGRAGNAEFRQATHYRLTFLYDGAPPTDEWRRIRSAPEAEAAARTARGQANKNRSPVTDSATGFSGGKRTTNRKSPVADSATTDTAKTATTVYISISGGRSGGGGGVVRRRGHGPAHGSRDDVVMQQPCTRLRLGTDTAAAAVNRRRLVDPAEATAALRRRLHAI
jgi:hypothetical protein